MNGDYHLRLNQDVNFLLDTLAHMYGLETAGLRVNDIKSFAEVCAALRVVTSAIELKAIQAESEKGGNT